MSGHYFFLQYNVSLCLIHFLCANVPYMAILTLVYLLKQMYNAWFIAHAYFFSFHAYVFYESHAVPQHVIALAVQIRVFLTLVLMRFTSCFMCMEWVRLVVNRRLKQITPVLLLFTQLNSILSSVQIQRSTC